VAPLLALCAASPAAAQTRDPAAATVLFEQGRAAIQAGDWAAACPKLEESHRLDPRVGTLLNLADCEEHIHKLAAARTYWQQAVDLAGSLGDARADLARQRLTALDPRVPRLSVLLADGSPPDAEVLRDGVKLGAASLGVSLPIDPGDHEIVVRAPGYEDGRATVSLAESEKKEISVSPGPKLPEAAPAVPAGPVPPVGAASTPPAPEPALPPVAPAPRSAARQDGGGSGLGTALFWTGLGGVTLGLVSGGLVLAARSDMEHGCSDDKICSREAADAASRGKTWSTVATISFAAGAALAAGGIYLMAARDGDEGSSAVGIVPTRTGGLVSIGRSF
jgi:hypothetical protein